MLKVLSCSTLLLALAGCSQPRQPYFAGVISGQPWLFDDEGQPIRSLGLSVRGMNSVSVDRRGLYAAAVSSECDGGGDLFELDVIKKRQQRLSFPQLEPYSLEKNEREILDSAAVAPAGSSIAFVARGCNPEHRYDAIEGSGFAFVFDRKSRKTRLLAGTKNEDGAPVGYAHSLSWAGDSSLLLVNFENGFRVLRAGNGSVVADGLTIASGTYLLAIG